MNKRLLSRPVLLSTRYSKKLMKLQSNKVLMYRQSPFQSPFKTTFKRGFHWIIEKLDDNNYTIRGQNQSSNSHFLNNSKRQNEQVETQIVVPFQNPSFIWNIVKSSDPYYPNHVSIISTRSGRLLSTSKEGKVTMSDKSQPHNNELLWEIFPGYHI